jgi:dihydroorotase
MYDLVLHNGHLLDPLNGLDRLGSVAFQNGRIAAIDPGPDAAATQRVDIGGALIVPGLIDLHVHVYDGGTSLGVRPEVAADASAATTLVDAGSAGAANFRGFREHIIASAESRILAFLNISFAGIFGFGADFSVGEGMDARLLQTVECRAAIEANRDLIVGIKARVGPSSSGDNGLLPLELALDVAAEMGLPVMVHIERAPPELTEVLGRLRPGDILTHCCRPLPNAVADAGGDILPGCLQARDHGVKFDTGHGRGSFSFASFRRMRDAGFLPDIVSSDIHAFNHRQRGVELITTMSKLLALEVPLETVVQLATANPAQALRRPDLGRIAVGAAGDVSVLALVAGPVTFADSTGEELAADRRFVARGAVRSGRWSPRVAQGVN